MVHSCTCYYCDRKLERKIQRSPLVSLIAFTYYVVSVLAVIATLASFYGAVWFESEKLGHTGMITLFAGAVFIFVGGAILSEKDVI